MSRKSGYGQKRRGAVARRYRKYKRKAKRVRRNRDGVIAWAVPGFLRGAAMDVDQPVDKEAHDLLMQLWDDRVLQPSHLAAAPLPPLYGAVAVAVPDADPLHEHKYDGLEDLLMAAAPVSKPPASAVLVPVPPSSVAVGKKRPVRSPFKTLVSLLPESPPHKQRPIQGAVRIFRSSAYLPFEDYYGNRLSASSVADMWSKLVARPTPPLPKHSFSRDLFQSAAAGAPSGARVHVDDRGYMVTDMSDQ